MSPGRSVLPDPDASRAVLIGVSEYRTVSSLPAVANNVATLRQLLTDPDLWGLRPEHCTTLVNPGSPGEVLEAVQAAAADATDALLVYFAGHALLSRHSDLYLALPDADGREL